MIHWLTIPGLVMVRKRLSRIMKSLRSDNRDECQPGRCANTVGCAGKRKAKIHPSPRPDVTNRKIRWLWGKAESNRALSPVCTARPDLLCTARGFPVELHMISARFAGPRLDRPAAPDPVPNPALQSERSGRIPAEQHDAMKPNSHSPRSPKFRNRHHLRHRVATSCRHGICLRP